MADQIINTLGFNVDEALGALARLDTALKTSGAAFTAFGNVLSNFNGQATEALKTMRSLASAATRLSGAMAGSQAAQPAAAAATPNTTGSQLWLPPALAAARQQQQQLNQLNQNLNQMANNANKAGQGLNNAGKQGAAGMRGANRETENLTVSLRTLNRVIMTQFIVRVMSQVRDLLKEAVQESMRFQTAIANIQTIAPRFGDALTGATDPTRFQSLTNEVAQFAKTYNISLDQAASGLYETISAQFTSVGQRTDLMRAAMKLSRVAVMDFDDAVALLTGTINAYGMDTSEADALSMKFFKTMELGTVRGKELADTLGQVIPIAAELGVSIDEINAAMVTLTIGGMDAHKSVTAMRAAMTAFLKPSDDMKAAIREMGFTDPKQLMAASGGFQEGMQAITDAAQGASLAVAASFRNVRAMTSVFRLTSQEGAQSYADALEVMKTTTPEVMDSILKEFEKVDANQLGKQWNALKVNLTQDFGSVLVKMGKDMFDMAGGADKLSAAIIAMTTALAPVVIILSAVAAAMLLASMAAGALVAPVVLLAAAVGALAGFNTYATLRNIQNIRAESQARREAVQENLRDMSEVARKARELETQQAKTDYGQWEKAASSIRRNYFKALDELKTKNEEITSHSRQTMESMIAAQERIVSAYRNAANANVKAVQDSQNRVMTLESQYADTSFKYAQQNASIYERANAYRGRALQLAREASAQLARARTPDDIQSALSAFQRADGVAKEAESIAQGTKNVQLKEDAERAVLSVMQQQLTAEKALQRTQAQAAQENAARAAKEQARVNEMKALQKSILDDMKGFDKNEARDPRALAAQEARLRANVARFQELSMQGQTVDVSTLLGLDSLQRKVEMALEGGASQVQVQELYSTPETFADFRRQVEQGIGPVRVLIERASALDPQLQRDMQGMSATERVDYLSNTLDQSMKDVIDYNAMGRELSVTRAAIAGFSRTAGEGFKKWAEDAHNANVSLKGLTVWSDVSKQPLKDEAQRFVDAAAEFTKPGARPTDRDFTELEAAYKRYLEVITPSEEQKVMLDNFFQDIESMKSAAQRESDIQRGMDAQRENVTWAEQRIGDIQAALKAAKEEAERTRVGTEAAYKGASNAQRAVKGVAQTDMTPLTTGIWNAATAMWSLASASAAVMEPTTVTPDSGEVLQSANGGQVRWLASGGRVGTDTVPAMLSPEEFVVKASSARKFASQLIAMNAGSRPVFRGDGGSVTNIGDINVSVQSGGSGRQTARTIATELRRELRRGTSTL